MDNETVDFKITNEKISSYKLDYDQIQSIEDIKKIFKFISK